MSVLRGHSGFSSPPQRPMTPDFEGFLYQILSIALFSYLNSWERASIKRTTGTIFITSLVWRGPWLGIEPGTSRTRSPYHVFLNFEKNDWSFTPMWFWNYIQCSGTAFYMSYIHPRTMYVVPMEKAWKDDSNHKYSQVDSKGFINKAACCSKCLLCILFFVYCFDNFDSIF